MESSELVVKKRSAKEKKSEDDHCSKSPLSSKGSKEDENKSPWGSKRSFLDVVKTDKTSERESKPAASVSKEN